MKRYSWTWVLVFVLFAGRCRSQCSDQVDLISNFYASHSTRRVFAFAEDQRPASNDFIRRVLNIAGPRWAAERSRNDSGPGQCHSYIYGWVKVSEYLCLTEPTMPNDETQRHFHDVDKLHIVCTFIPLDDSSLESNCRSATRASNAIKSKVNSKSF